MQLDLKRSLMITNKLENRVMNEIVSNVNLSEIDIEEGLFRDDAQYDSDNLCPCSNNPAKEQNEEKNIVSRPNNLSEHKENDGSENGDSSNIRLSNIDIESIEEEKEEIVADKDFMDLKMNAEEDVSEWSQVCKTDEVIVFKKKTEGSPMILVKAVATLRGIPAEIVFKAIYDTDIRQTWDKLFYRFEVVEHDEEKLETVLYYIIKAPFGISNRDFLQRRRVMYNFPKKDVTTMHFKSIEHPDKPPVSGIIRAETILSGYIIEQIQDDPPVSQLIVISQNDIKGLIPKYLVNLASGRAPKQWIANLIDGCHSLMKEEGYSIS